MPDISGFASALQEAADSIPTPPPQMPESLAKYEPPVAAEPKVSVLSKIGRLFGAGLGDPFMRKALMAGVAAFAVLSLILFAGRAAIAKAMPVMAGFYHVLGMPAPKLGAGLAFDQVRSEQRLVDGIMSLVIEGKLKNVSEDEVKVPNIVATAFGPDDKKVTSWNISPPALNLLAQGETKFESIIRYPGKPVADVTLMFADREEE
jgi:hypothetical protein